jgi:DNA-binding transcriptional LysR family regulator
VLQFFETFCVVADSGSLSRAAETLHLTQPAVTRQIKALEQDLGAVLLTRSSHGVVLTPVGEQVLVYAKQALQAVAAARRTAGEMTPGENGRLAIAAGNMVMQFIVAPVLATFRIGRHDLPIELHTGHYQECLDRLITYEVDLALISTATIPIGLKAKRLFTDPIMLVTAPGTALADRVEVDLSSLEGSLLFVLPKAAGLRQQLNHILADVGVKATLSEQHTVEGIKTMVGLGLGATLLPRSAVDEEVLHSRLVAVRVRDWPDNGRSVLAVTRGEGVLADPAKAFLAALHDRYGRMG